MWCGSGRGGRARLRSDSECSTYDEECRILVVGAQGVGKTALCHAFVCGEDHSSQRLPKSNRGRRGEFNMWEDVDGETCCMRLYELRMTGKGEEDEQIVRSLTQSADGFILIYSILDRHSFGVTQKLYDVIRQIRNSTDTPLVLVGNKSDQNCVREVLMSEGRNLAFDIGTAFYETSARRDRNQLSSIFHDVIRQVRCVRSRCRAQEQSCNRVRGLIHRLSLRSKRKNFKRQSTS